MWLGKRARARARPSTQARGLEYKVFGWPKSSFQFVYKYNSLRENPNKLFGQPDSLSGKFRLFTTSL